MRTLSIICTIFWVGLHCVAQPEWNIVTYPNSTTAYGIVTIDGIPAEVGDIVGAFVGEECRAKGNPIISGGVAYITLVIQGESVETAEFKIYDTDRDLVLDVDYTTLTSPGGVIGYPPDYLPINATSNSNNPPVADAGPDQTVDEGVLVTLDGSGSADPDGDALTYAWTAPAGITLSDASAQMPTFTAPDVEASTVYDITLVVNDGLLDSGPDMVSITVNPVSGCDDPFGEIVTYPNSTTAYGIVTVGGLAAEEADIVAAFVGEECRAKGNPVISGGVAYITLVVQGESVEELEFRVFDQSECSVCADVLRVSSNPGGNIGYPPDYLIIDACPSNRAPVADAGPDQTVDEGVLVTLDGSGSADPDGDALTYAWTAPAGITLSDASAQMPTFTAPDVEASTVYDITLVVNDGLLDSGPDMVSITVNPVSGCDDPFGEIVTYPNSTTAYGIVTVGGLAAEEADIVAAFVGEECRAKGNPVISGRCGLYNPGCSGRECRGIGVSGIRPERMFGMCRRVEGEFEPWRKYRLPTGLPYHRCLSFQPGPGS